MDPFATLPAEIRLKILFQLDHSSQAKTLSYASRIIYQQRQISADVLENHFRCKDLTDDLVQDAMAIILFPTTCFQYNDERKSRIQIHSHFKIWGKKQLPNPLETGDPAMLNALDALIRQVTLYMEDYISKATSVDMLRAYFQLPRWAHPSYTRDSPESEAVDLIKASSLSAKERNRLMHAFLRHEMLCKVHYPRPMTWSTWTENNVQYYRHHSSSRGFKLWDWRFLEIFENATEVRIDQRRDWTRSRNYPLENPRPVELLQCVNEYVRTLYGVLAAQVPHEDWYILSDGLRTSDSQMTAKSSHQTTTSELSTPTNGGDAYFNDYWLHVGGLENGFDNQLASCGFNLLTSMLTSEKSSCQEFFKDFLEEVYTGDLVRICSDPISQSGNQRNTAYPRYMYLHVSYALHDPNKNKRWLQNRHLRTCRQRAWALFDSARLYPDSSEFAAISSYEAREDWFWNRYNDATRFQYFAHDRWEINTRFWSQDLPHPYASDYPSLSERIEKPFWQANSTPKGSGPDHGAITALSTRDSDGSV